MNAKQKAAEERSIKKFIADALHQVRPRGTNGAVTCVLLTAAQAAANMAARTSTGAIDQAQAARIFHDATRLMITYKQPKKGK